MATTAACLSERGGGKYYYCYYLLLVVVLLFLRSSESRPKQYKSEEEKIEAFFEDVFRYRGLTSIIPLTEPHHWHTPLPRPTHLSPISSFSLHNPSPSGFTLAQHAHMVYDDDHHGFVLRLSNYSGVMCDHPVQLTPVEATTSFTTEITFSIPPPPPVRNYWQPAPSRRLSFHLLREENNTDYGTHIQFNSNSDEVQIGETSGFMTVAPLGFDLDSGNKLHAWIDYQGRNKTLEIRVSESAVRPDDPVLADRGRDFLGNSSVWFGIGVTSVFPAATIYSWNFNVST